MQVSQAHNLKPGANVYCPSDRGEAAYVGQVEGTAHVGAKPCNNAQGIPYVWVTVRHRRGVSTWPSNRLGGC